MFFKETGIIEETRSIASSYFNSSLEYLKNLDGINTNELTQLVELIEKRTY
jgi:geranylgeranyl pyrophosphate synthase